MTIKTQNEATESHPFDWTPSFNPSFSSFPWSCLSKLRGFDKVSYSTIEEARTRAIDLNRIEDWHSHYTPEVMAKLTMP